MIAVRPPSDTCCLICGHETCFQSYDHTKFTLPQLQPLLLHKHHTPPDREALDHSIQKFYTRLMNDVVKLVEKDRQTALETLKKFDFGFLKQHRKVSVDLVAELACGNYSSLPSRRLIPVIEVLQQTEPSPAPPPSDHCAKIEKTMKQYLTVENFLRQKSSIISTLLSPLLFKEKDKIQQLSKRLSIRQCDNPEEPLQADLAIRIDIRGRIITQKSTQAEINNRNIDDNDIVASINQLKKVKKLTKVQIRNNKITSLTCKMIAFNLPKLIKLDVRGNNLGDEGIVVLAQNLSLLKEFYVSENRLTDFAVQEIFSNLKQLTMLWMENNKITMKGASLIITLEKLRAVALLGNSFTVEEGQVLKNKFFGYISV